ncbi:MAG TPA: hypothetical protein VFV34_07440, partial [Blastocatellia bacterium]|nr:hypothetical protein [Blastocatellia bacterium]
MSNQFTRVSGADRGPVERSRNDLTIRHYEILSAMSTQMLATHSLSERLSLALDTIRAGLGYSSAAIALIDDRSRVLRVRMAVGFKDCSAVEQIEMPLDSTATGASVIFEG